MENKLPSWDVVDLQYGSCDFDCIFCTRSHRFSKGNGFYDLKSQMEEIKSAMERMRETSNSGTLNIYGRDVTDKLPVLKDLCEFAKSLGYEHLKIWSSGIRFFDDSLVKGMESFNVDLLEIPIYGHNADLHDRIVGMPGSFDKLVASIRNLNEKSKIRISMHTVVVKENVKYLKGIINFIRNELKIAGNITLFHLLEDANCDKDSYEKRAGNFRSNCPKYSEVFAALAGADLKNIDICDFPVCVKRKLGAFGEIPEATLNFVRADKNGVKLTSKKYPEINSNSRKCRLCKTRCSGLSPFYEEIYGGSEIEPLL